jgi:hypothetical protein
VKKYFIFIFAYFRGNTLFCVKLRAKIINREPKNSDFGHQTGEMFVLLFLKQSLFWVEMIEIHELFLVMQLDL